MDLVRSNSNLELVSNEDSRIDKLLRKRTINVTVQRVGYLE